MTIIIIVLCISGYIDQERDTRKELRGRIVNAALAFKTLLYFIRHLVYVKCRGEMQLPFQMGGLTDCNAIISERLSDTI